MPVGPALGSHVGNGGWILPSGQVSSDGKLLASRRPVPGTLVMAQRGPEQVSSSWVWMAWAPRAIPGERITVLHTAAASWTCQVSSIHSNTLLKVSTAAKLSIGLLLSFSHYLFHDYIR